MAKSIYLNPEDKKAAMSWWNSLLGGKKRYLKEHSKLTTEDKIVRFWLASIKPADTSATVAIKRFVSGGPLQGVFNKAHAYLNEPGISPDERNKRKLELHAAVYSSGNPFISTSKAD
mgnify:FL=1